MLKCTSTISEFTTLMDCMRTNVTIPATLREPSLNTRELCYDYEEFLAEIKETPLPELFRWRMTMLSRPDGFMLYVAKWGLILSPLL